MAQLTNTLVNGDLRVTGNIYGNLTGNVTGTATTATNANNIKVTTATTTKLYLTGVEGDPGTSGTNKALKTDTGIYADTTAGKLVATTFSGSLSGNATTATDLATNSILSVIKGGTGKSSVTSGNFLVGNGTSALTEKTPAEVRTLIGAGTSSLTLGNGAGNAYYGDKGKTAYDHSQSTHAPTTSKSEASGGTETSLVTTGEKYTWNHKQSALPTSGTPSTTYAINISGSSASAASASVASSVSKSLTVQFNSGSTEGTDKFTYNGSAAKTVNISTNTILSNCSTGTDNFWTTDNIIASSHSNGATVSNEWTRRTGEHILAWLAKNAQGEYGSDTSHSPGANKMFGLMIGDYHNQNSGNIAGWRILQSTHGSAYGTVQFKAIISISIWTDCTGNTTGTGIKGNVPSDFFGVVEIYARMGSSVSTSNLKRYGRLVSFYPSQSTSSNVGWSVKAKINSDNSIDWYIGYGDTNTLTPSTNLAYSKISILPIVFHGNGIRYLDRVTETTTCTQQWFMYKTPVFYADDNGQAVGTNTTFHEPYYLNSEGMWEAFGCRMSLPEKTAEADIRIGYNSTHRTYLCSTSDHQGLYTLAGSYEDWLVWMDNNGLGHLKGVADSIMDQGTSTPIYIRRNILGNTPNTLYIL